MSGIVPDGIKGGQLPSTLKAAGDNRGDAGLIPQGPQWDPMQHFDQNWVPPGGLDPTIHSITPERAKELMEDHAKIMPHERMNSTGHIPLRGNHIPMNGAEYPKVLYHADKGQIVVRSSEHEQIAAPASDGWVGNPGKLIQAPAPEAPAQRNRRR